MQRKWKWAVALALVLAFIFSSVGQVSAQPSSMVRVLIGYNRPTGASDESLIRGRGGILEHRFHHIPVISAEVPERMLPILRAQKGVEYVELDSEVQALEQTLPWGVDRIDAEKVHPYDQGSGVKVAIIDTGIDLEHEDLHVAGNVTFVSGTSNGDDDNGHGTHVAGIVAALNNNIGVVGVAPQVELYAVKVLNSKGSGYWSSVISGIDWAIDNDMDIINMSLGSSLGSTPLQQICDNAYSGRDNPDSPPYDILIVAAAGNSGSSGSTADSVVYPARYSSVVAVGATDSSDRRASWSSTGSAVELAAPGASIYSTYYNNRYTTLSGTSMASPHVAGVAALVTASGIADSNSDGRINDEVRLRLQQTAHDLGTPGRDPQYGYGLVDAYAAVPPLGNRAPVANAGSDQIVVVNNLVTLDGSASYDPDGDPLTYLWTQTAGASVTLSDSTAIKPTFTPTVPDTYTFQLVANDGELDSAPDTVVITVRAANTPPTAPVVDVTPDSPLTSNNLVCSIVTPSNDTDGDPITYFYAWYKNDVLQAGLTGNTVSASYTAKGQVWKCVVTPNDGTDNGPTGSDQVTILNSPPVARAGSDQTVVVNTPVTLNGSASSDPDGDPLTYLWAQIAGASVTLSDSTAIKPTFTPTVLGTYTFELVVNDGSTTDSDDVSVSVTEVPALVMHIDRIDMSLVQAYAGWRTYAGATVTIVDPLGNPVAGATVRGSWTGATSGTSSGRTGSNGQVTFRSTSLRLPPSGTTFTFTVDSVTKSGWTYDTGANGETSDSVSVP